MVEYVWSVNTHVGPAHLTLAGAVIILFLFMTLLLMCCGSALWAGYRAHRIKTIAYQMKQEGSGFGKPLLFHSPDDTPRNFVQAGYVRSWVGTIVVYSWIVLPAVCYAIMIPWTYIAYTVGSGWYFPPSVAFWQNVFGDWDGCVLPWCVNFTIAHLVGLIMAKLWGVLNTMALLPVTTMESATHVVITEDFKVDPDDVHDPDEKHDVLESISLWFHGVTKKYHSAETTVVVAITDQEEYRQN